jgi:molybdate transport system regulatory protein
MNPLSVRFRVDIGPACSVGPGKVALLLAIERSGSLSQAARELGMSYRHAWQLLADLNHGFRAPVTEASVGGVAGGGATLTEFGRRLVAAYRRCETDFEKRALKHFADVAGQAVRGGAPLLSRRPLRRARR